MKEVTEEYQIKYAQLMCELKLLEKEGMLEDFFKSILKLAKSS